MYKLEMEHSWVTQPDTFHSGSLFIPLVSSPDSTPFPQALGNSRLMLLITEEREFSATISVCSALICTYLVTH